MHDTKPRLIRICAFTTLTLATAAQTLQLARTFAETYDTALLPKTQSHNPRAP